MKLPTLPLIGVIVAIVATGCSTTAPPVCSGTTVQLRRDDTLTAGTDRAYAPFAFDDVQTGTPAGFEVDLLDEISDRLGLKLLLVNRNSSALISGLLGRRHDIAASALRDDAELRSQVCLTAPILDADLGILTSADNPFQIRGPRDLTGRSVGVVEGTPAEVWAAVEVPFLERVKTPEDLLSRLRTGDIDAVVADLAVARHTTTVSPEFDVVAHIETGQSYVMALHPENAALLELVNEALEDLRADGTFDEVVDRWFGS